MISRDRYRSITEPVHEYYLMHYRDRVRETSILEDSKMTELISKFL